MSAATVSRSVFSFLGALHCLLNDRRPVYGVEIHVSIAQAESNRGDRLKEGSSGLGKDCHIAPQRQ